MLTIHSVMGATGSGKTTVSTTDSHIKWQIHRDVVHQPHERLKPTRGSRPAIMHECRTSCCTI
jgi:hypothetical protein